MTDTAYETVLVPIANVDDAVNTGDAIADRFGGSYVVATHVLEKAGGAPDPAGVEQREAYAERLFDTFLERVRGSDATVETRVEYGTDVADRLLAVADEIGADAIVFVPRGESRWHQLLSGDVGRKLISRTDRPVLVLPGDDV